MTDHAKRFNFMAEDRIEYGTATTMQLAAFLKQHSAVSNDFIDKFLSIYDPDTVQTDFVVNLNIACTWLGVKKPYLVQTLKDSYKEGIDYVTRKGPRPAHVTGRGGNHNKEWLLTPDCFKRLCMRSRSKRAEEVRTYFIQLESLLVRYKSVLLQGISAEMKQLQSSVRPKDPGDSAGYLYVIKASPERDSVYKIGRTQDLNKRLATYSTGSALGVQVVFKFRTDSHRKTEACVKVMLKERQLRKYKEVYECDLDMIKAIIHKCDEASTYTRLHANARADREMKGGYYMVLEKD